MSVAFCSRTCSRASVVTHARTAAAGARSSGSTAKRPQQERMSGSLGKVAWIPRTQGEREAGGSRRGGGGAPTSGSETPGRTRPFPAARAAPGVEGAVLLPVNPVRPGLPGPGHAHSACNPGLPALGSRRPLHDVPIDSMILGRLRTNFRFFFPEISRFDLIGTGSSFGGERGNRVSRLR